jgi:hypothetical protein
MAKVGLVDLVGLVMAMVGLVMAMVGSARELVARLGLWCQCHLLSNSRKNTMILDDHF